MYKESPTSPRCGPSSLGFSALARPSRLGSTHIGGNFLASRTKHERYRRSAHLHQLLQAPQPGRDRLALGADAAAPIGEADFADIDVAARIDREPVRRDELAGLEPGMRVAEARQEFALMGVDADPRTAIRDIDVD